MVKILNVCKDELAETRPFFIKNVCNGRENKLIITQNDIELYSIPIDISKAVLNYETFKKIIKPNSYTKLSLDTNPAFYLFKPKYISTLDWESRNVQLISSSDIERIANNLNTTPNSTITLGLVNTIETSSYQPIIKIQSVYTEEEILITIKDSIGNSVPFTFNSTNKTIIFSNNLLGNGAYDIEIKYLEKSGDSIINTTVKDYTIKVIKKKLEQYDYVEVSSNQIIDIDNDVEVIVENIPKGISLEQVSVSIPGIHFNVRERKIIRVDDTYTMKLKIDFVGNLHENESYTVTLSNLYDILNGEELSDITINFYTRPFHSFVSKFNFSDIFLRISNVDEANDYFYLVNNSPTEISVCGLIAYSDKNIDIIPMKC